MASLRVLLVLLPLVALASALNNCDNNIIQKILASPQVGKPILKNLGGQKFWLSSAPDKENGPVTTSVEITPFNGKSADMIVTDFENGKQVSQSQTSYTDGGDYVVNDSETRKLYFVQCSEDILFIYRCQVEGAQDKGTSVPYHLWSSWDKTDVTAQEGACKKLVENIDSSIQWVSRSHP